MIVSRRIVLILIHGTFAENARWTRVGSDFRTRVAASLGDSTTFEVFPWGRFNNSQALRLRAARDLATFVCERAAIYPDAAIFLVGHSHGGNVALYAMRNKEASSKVAGLVFLSTPFIHVQDRESALWLAWAAIPFFALIWLLDIHFHPNLPLGINPAASWFQVLKAGSLVAYVISLLVSVKTAILPLLFIPLVPSMVLFALQESACTKNSLPKDHGVSMFYAFVDNDEPAHLLRAVGATFGVVTWVFSNAITVVASAVLIFLALEHRSKVLSYFVSQSAYGIGDAVAHFLETALLSFGCIGLSIVVAAGLQIIIGALMFNLPFTYGWNGLVGSYIVEISAETAPPDGVCSRCEVKPKPFAIADATEIRQSLRFWQRLTLLQHSIAYMSPLVSCAVCDWIKTTLASMESAMNRQSFESESSK